MRIAFYAPMKPPDAPRPSGDRRIARLIMDALTAGGHRVEIACRFVSRSPDPRRQPYLAATGRTLAAALIRRMRHDPPDAWLTYHLYHKAPDWIGPPVAAALNIPYFLVEASSARRQADGPWRTGYRAAAAAIGQAAGILTLNPDDRAGLLPLLATPARLHETPPFLDTGGRTAPCRAAAGRRLRHRLGLPRHHHLLLAVGMLRHGDKTASYRLLARALGQLPQRNWTLLVAGDGPARRPVRAMLAGLGPGRVRWLGTCPPDRLAGLYRGCDIMVWPAIREAIGMAVLEAQAAGLPVVAGAAGALPGIVRQGRTGYLGRPGDAAALARATGRLLASRRRRLGMGRAALATVRRCHDLPAATAALNAMLGGAAGPPAPPA